MFWTKINKNSGLVSVQLKLILFPFPALFKLLKQPQSSRCLQFHTQPPALLRPADPHGGREQKQRGRGLRAEPALRRAQPGGPALPLRPLVRNSPGASQRPPLPPWNPFWGFLSLDSSCRWIGILLRLWFVWVLFCFAVYLVSIITEQSRTWHLCLCPGILSVQLHFHDLRRVSGHECLFSSIFSTMCGWFSASPHRADDLAKE